MSKLRLFIRGVLNGSPDIRWNDPHFADGYDRWQAHRQAKTANVLFAVELDRLAASHGVRAFALHPGSILKPLQRHFSRDEMVAMGWVDAEGGAPIRRSSRWSGGWRDWFTVCPRPSNEEPSARA